jgi:hypothetical protein
MKKVLPALLAAAAIAFAAMVAPAPVEARCVGCAVGAGIIGGIAAGALIAGAANAGPPPPAYYAPAPAYGPGPGCYYTRQRMWDDYYQVWRRGPRVLVCP